MNRIAKLMALAIGALLPVAASHALPIGVDSGVVGRWNMSPVPDPAGYKRVLDSSGHLQHGRIYGGEVGSYGWMNQSANMVGGQYVEIPNSSHLNFGTRSFTLAAWVRITDFQSSTKFKRKTIVDNRGSDGRGYSFAIQGGEYLQLRMIDETGSIDLNSDGVNIHLNRWYHVAVSVNRTSWPVSVSFYVDGFEVGSTVPAMGNINNTDRPFFIGARGDASHSRFNDRVDEVFAYNRALADWEVWNVLAPGQPTFTPLFWTGGLQQSKNNCYNYAVNNANRTYAQPGMASIGPPVSMSCAALRIGAIADGLEPIEEDAVFHFKKAVALVSGQSGGIPDFHWYRRDADGMWSHKPGQFVPRNTDESGEAINDPRYADRGGYTDFCGFFLAWTDAVEGSGHEYIR